MVASRLIGDDCEHRALAVVQDVREVSTVCSTGSLGSICSSRESNEEDRRDRRFHDEGKLGKLENEAMERRDEATHSIYTTSKAIYTARFKERALCEDDGDTECEWGAVLLTTTSI